MSKPDPDHWASVLLGPQVRIDKVSPFVAETCRCGSRLVAGVERFQVANPPPSIEYLLQGRGFCSLVCVRAFLLEALSEIDSFASPASSQVVIDLRGAYLDLNRTISDLGLGVVGTTR